MRERVVTFGPDAGLVGIVTEPNASERRPGAPAVVVSNVGLHHRVGPYRAWVDLARELASAGVVTLRFDVSGLGDSRARDGADGDVQRAADDVRSAMDLLAARWAVDRFALVGLCSGVDAVHRVTVGDPRVAAAAFVDGYNYPTLGWLARRLTLQLVEGARWRRWARRKLHRAGARELGQIDEIYVREYPPPAELARDLDALARRGTRMLFLYSGTLSHFSHRDQFFAMLPGADLRGRVEVEHWREADHTFSTLAARKRLVARLTAFVRDA